MDTKSFGSLNISPPIEAVFFLNSSASVSDDRDDDAFLVLKSPSSSSSSSIINPPPRLRRRSSSSSPRSSKREEKSSRDSFVRLTGVRVVKDLTTVRLLHPLFAQSNRRSKFDDVAVRHPSRSTDDDGRAFDDANDERCNEDIKIDVVRTKTISIIVRGVVSTECCSSFFFSSTTLVIRARVKEVCGLPKVQNVEGVDVKMTKNETKINNKRTQQRRPTTPIKSQQENNKKRQQQQIRIIVRVCVHQCARVRVLRVFRYTCVV